MHILYLNIVESINNTIFVMISKEMNKNTYQILKINKYEIL
jgi:hypothetical protein